MAPVMSPTESNAPSATVGGASSSTTATSSAKPVAIRPQGSAPSVAKMYFDSSAPLNLKNSVCARIAAATTCSVQLTAVLILQDFIEGASFSCDPFPIGIGLCGEAGFLFIPVLARITPKPPVEKKQP